MVITIASVRLVGACNSFQNSNAVTAHPSFIYLDSKDPGDKTLMIAQCSAGQNVAGNALSSLELVYAQQAMPTLSGGGDRILPECTRIPQAASKQTLFVDVAQLNRQEQSVARMCMAHHTATELLLDTHPHTLCLISGKETHKHPQTHTKNTRSDMYTLQGDCARSCWQRLHTSCAQDGHFTCGSRSSSSLGLCTPQTSWAPNFESIR